MFKPAVYIPCDVNSAVPFRCLAPGGINSSSSCGPDLWAGVCRSWPCDERRSEACWKRRVVDGNDCFGGNFDYCVSLPGSGSFGLLSLGAEVKC
jgi:hypothetical protein